MRTLLHVGCGQTALPAWLDGYSEVRLDINPDVQPDIVASMLDLGPIGPFDALYSSHCLEHLYPHEVGIALAEFRRVLKPNSMAVVIVPNLEGVEPTEAVIYHSPSGPITGLDMIYGMGAAISINPYLAHHCGFVRETLKACLEAAGFDRCDVVADEFHNLIGAAVTA